MSPQDLAKQIATIEESYEFFLAYAAQGVTDDTGTSSGGEVRRFLTQMEESLGTIVQTFRAVVGERAAGGGADGGDEFRAMIDVLEGDVAKARAAVRLVLSRPSISSQLIDNLNASMHVRTLLTDLFLMDEALPPADSKTTA